MPLALPVGRAAWALASFAIVGRSTSLDSGPNSNSFSKYVLHQDNMICIVVTSCAQGSELSANSVQVTTRPIQIDQISCDRNQNSPLVVEVKLDSHSHCIRVCPKKPCKLSSPKLECSVKNPAGIIRRSFTGKETSSLFESIPRLAKAISYFCTFDTGSNSIPSSTEHERSSAAVVSTRTAKGCSVQTQCDIPFLAQLNAAAGV